MVTMSVRPPGARLPAGLSYRPRAALWPAVLGVVGVGLVGLVVAAHFAEASIDRTATGGIMAFIGGMFLRSRLRGLSGRPKSPFLLGLLVSVAAVLLRIAPLLFGSPHAVRIGPASVVIGEMAVVVAIVGAGLLMSAVAGDDRRTLGLTPGRLVVTRLAAVGVAVVPILAFAALSLSDLGPLVILAVAVVVMIARAVRSRYALLILALGGAWLAASVLAAVPLARARLTDVLFGDYQLDLARIAVAHGGLLWSGGIGSNAYAEAIPVAESDYLVAFLVSSWGAIPTLLIVAALLLSLRQLARRLVGADDPGAVAALGIVAAAIVQTLWSCLGALGILPLTGVAVPLLSAAGSSWLAWGFGLGFVVWTGGRRQVRLAGPDRVGRATVAAAGVVPIAALAMCVVVCAALLVGPEAQGTSTGYASLADRGRLLSRDGVELATTDADGTRRWPLGADAVEVVGGLTPGVNQWGMEQIAAPDLVCGGTDILSSLRGLVGPRCRPSDVMSTVDSRIQRAIVDALHDVPHGSAVVLDGATLDLLGAASIPGREDADRDPSGLATGSLDLDAYAPSASGSPLRPAVLTDEVMPGSVFKVPLLAAASEAGVVASDAADADVYDGVENSWGGSCPDGTAETAIAYSCNTVTASIASAVGAERLAGILHRTFGLDGSRRVDGEQESSGSTGLADVATDGALARTAIGLEGVRVSLVGLGEMYAHALGMDAGATPGRIIGRCVPGSLPTREARDSDPVGEPVSDATTDIIRAGMRRAAAEGTASVLGTVPALHGHEVLAKTGTPDRSEAGQRIFDSLAVVVVDGVVIVVRVPGGPGAPAASALLPAAHIAETVVDTISGESKVCPGGAQ